VRARFFLLIPWLLLSWTLSAKADDQSSRQELKHSGYLVLSAARDTTSDYHWSSGPGAERRSLVWSCGVLNIPVNYEIEDFGPFDLAIPCTERFGGVGKTGRLIMTDGKFEINEPVLLTDGTVFFFAEDGLLEFVASRIRYFPPEVKEKVDPRASFMLLGGLLVLIAVLVRRSRRIIKKRANIS